MDRDTWFQTYGIPIWKFINPEFSHSSQNCLNIFRDNLHCITYVIHHTYFYCTVIPRYTSNRSLIRDAQINACFSIYEPIFAYMSSFLSQTDFCSRRLFSGSNGKLIFVLRVFALRAVLEDLIKLVNRGIPVYYSVHIPSVTLFVSLKLRKSNGIHLKLERKNSHDWPKLNTISDTHFNNIKFCKIRYITVLLKLSDKQMDQYTLVVLCECSPPSNFYVMQSRTTTIIHSHLKISLYLVLQQVSIYLYFFFSFSFVLCLIPYFISERDCTPLQYYYKGCIQSNQQLTLSFLMHTIHSSSATYPYQELERRTAQETLIGCAGL
jgi:hypothetical protein